MSSSASITLYIPCFNAKRTLAECLEGVMAQTRPADEILVIDDGSTDGSAEIAEQLPVRVIQHEVNRGLGAARNTALEAAGGDLVASLDADCVPDPNWLGRLADQLEPDNVIGAGGQLV
ncbi:MAG: glycosyltransferase family 2 protein, partial [Phycisphaeraceae bacterium]|nr:glycosyltransferase family 2 protein [Phycisphaeraceae bacterium]